MRPEVDVWWEQAKTDLEAAEAVLRDGFYYLCVFQCEQAAEKSLKALFLRRGGKSDAPEMITHSLVFVAKACKVPEEFHRFLKDLTSEYIGTRYPSATGGPPKARYNREIAARMLSSTKEVVEWISRRM